jgi:hypothetical protein
MPTIPSQCEIIVPPDSVRFTTRTNGDTVTIKGVDLDNENAAALAWLINQQGNLQVRIREEP